MERFKNLLEILLDWLFPHSCVGCGREDCLICAKCREKMPVRERQECPYCRRDSEWGQRCAGCVGRGRLDGVICLWDYEKAGILARLLHFYKYKGWLDYGEVLKETFGELGRKRLRESGVEVDLVCWIPMSERKMKVRGFNQSEELAGALTKGNSGSEAVELLFKVRETSAQMTLKRVERLSNLKGCFKISPKELKTISGQSVLVIDDIATTLATLEEVAGALKAAGAQKVFGLVAARQKE